MPGERMGPSGLVLLGVLAVAVVAGVAILLLANARRDAPMRTDVVSSASSRLAAGGSQ
jgi:hypothetical protein